MTMVWMIVLSCGDNGGGGSTANGSVDGEPTDSSGRPTAVQLWQELLQADPQANWPLLPGYDWPKMGESSAHRAHLENVYVNPESLSAVQLGATGEIPEGTTIVKYVYENRDPADPGNIEIVAVMRKGAGFNPEAGDWFWVEYDGAGKALFQQSSGKDGTCTTCHGGAVRDYMWLAR